MINILFVDSRCCPLAATMRRVFEGTLLQVVVHVANNRETALRLATEHRPQIVLVMGRSAETPTGPEIIDEIRSLYQPIWEILISGGAEVHARALAVLGGVQYVHVLATSFMLHGLTRIILILEAIESLAS